LNPCISLLSCLAPHVSLRKSAQAEGGCLQAAPEPGLEVGGEVECTWGRGIVREIRPEGVYVVQSNKWRLAGGQAPMFYLQVRISGNWLVATCALGEDGMMMVVIPLLVFQGTCRCV
jgi:hypothetical protein